MLKKGLISGCGALRNPLEIGVRNTTRYSGEGTSQENELTTTE